MRPGLRLDSRQPSSTEVLMRRILLAVVIAVGLALSPLAVGAPRQAGKVYRVGYLRHYGCAEPAQFTELRQGLRDLGYAEGHNLVIECRAAPGKAERIPDLAAELVRLNVDVIVAEGTVSALAAKQATRTIPIVMVYIADPVASGLVSSLGRPGGNVTGSTMLGPEIVRKNIQLLKEAAPAISRVTVLIDSSNPGQTLPDQQMAAAAKILGVRPQRTDIVTSADLDKAFAAVLRQRAQALLVYPLPLTPGEFQRVTSRLRRRLGSPSRNRSWCEPTRSSSDGPAHLPLRADAWDARGVARRREQAGKVWRIGWLHTSPIPVPGQNPIWDIHDRDGALAHQRHWNGLGAHILACCSAGSMGRFATRRMSAKLEGLRACG